MLAVIKTKCLCSQGSFSHRDLAALHGSYSMMLEGHDHFTCLVEIAGPGPHSSPKHEDKL